MFGSDRTQEIKVFLQSKLQEMFPPPSNSSHAKAAKFYLDSKVIPKKHLLEFIPQLSEKPSPEHTFKIFAAVTTNIDGFSLEESMSILCHLTRLGMIQQYQDSNRFFNSIISRFEPADRSFKVPPSEIIRNNLSPLLWAFAIIGVKHVDRQLPLNTFFPLVHYMADLLKYEDFLALGVIAMPFNSATKDRVTVAAKDMHAMCLEPTKKDCLSWAIEILQPNTDVSSPTPSVINPSFLPTQPWSAIQPPQLASLPTAMPLSAYSAEYPAPPEMIFSNPMLMMQQSFLPFSQPQFLPVSPQELFPQFLLPSLFPQEQFSALQQFPLQTLQDQLQIQEQLLIQAELLFKEQFSFGLQQLFIQVQGSAAQLKGFQNPLPEQLQTSWGKFDAHFQQLLIHHEFYIQRQMQLPSQLTWKELHDQLQGLQAQFQELLQQIPPQPQKFDSKAPVTQIPDLKKKEKLTEVKTVADSSPAAQLSPSSRTEKSGSAASASLPVLSQNPHTLLSNSNPLPTAKAAVVTQSEPFDITIIICKKATPQGMMLNYLYIPALDEGRSCVLKTELGSEAKKTRLSFGKAEGSEIASIIYVDPLNCEKLISEVKKSLKDKKLFVNIVAIVKEDGLNTKVIYPVATQTAAPACRA